jgi:hypothetical protein
MSIKSDGRNEWIALARVQFEKAICEAKCIDIMEEHGMSLKGKTYIPDLLKAAESVKSCISMVVQYSDS